ncbi:MAG: hypothetical protein C0177_07315 [Fervidicoccus fontis]|nr:MAG: hypothetical protein C0177_07315 [Fervidicoccus fontis]
MLELIYINDENQIVFERVSYDALSLYSEPLILKENNEVFIWYKNNKIKLTDTSDRKYRFKIYKAYLMRHKLFR